MRTHHHVSHGERAKNLLRTSITRYSSCQRRAEYRMQVGHDQVTTNLTRDARYRYATEVCFSPESRNRGRLPVTNGSHVRSGRFRPTSSAVADDEIRQELEWHAAQLRETVSFRPVQPAELRVLEDTPSKKYCADSALE